MSTSFDRGGIATLAGYSLFKQQPLFALSLLQGFYGLLRTEEILNIQNKDVAQANACSVAVIYLTPDDKGRTT